MKRLELAGRRAARLSTDCSLISEKDIMADDCYARTDRESSCLFNILLD
jgi:hypothetical protein